jgi:hypothetical protein
MWRLLVVVVAFLVLSTSAWADITGSVYRVPGNLLNAGPASIVGGTLEGSFTAPAINFIVPETQPTTNPLREFLNSGSASWTTMAGLDDVMSNCPYNLTTTNPSCYSTAIHIIGGSVFTNGVTYSIRHDDGVVVLVDGNPFISDPGPTAPSTSSATFLGTTGLHTFDVWYMATNGNPEVLQSNNIGTPEAGSILLLGCMWVTAGAALRRRFRNG